jgi:signal transduction histidine kinase
MSFGLSHELPTPVAVVNSSLDNLLLVPQSDENKQYLDRAKQGITRLSKILTNQGEATPLQQAIGLPMLAGNLIYKYRSLAPDFMVPLNCLHQC